MGYLIQGTESNITQTLLQIVIYTEVFCHCFKASWTRKRLQLNFGNTALGTVKRTLSLWTGPDQKVRAAHSIHVFLAVPDIKRSESAD